MRLKLQQRLILSYFSLALMIIGLISFLVNVSVKKGFENYIIEEHNQLVSEVVSSVEHSYTESGFDIEDLEHLGIEAIEKGLIISIYDLNDELIWSAMEHNAGLCEAMITNVKENMFNHYSSWDGNYTEDTFTLSINTDNIGRLNVGYLGPFYFNEEELYFLSSINKLLIFVGAFSLLFAVIIGIIISHGLTKPIAAIVHHLDHMHDNKSPVIPKSINKTLELKKLYHAAMKLETRINEQEKLRKQLTQDMAHELKTPLTAIQGQLEAMIDGIFPLTKDRLKSTHEEILRIKSLITEIESLSIIENSNTTLDVHLFNLETLIKTVLHDFEADLLAHQMDASIEYSESYQSESYQKCYGDPYKLKQAFINLISNAIKYAGDNTTIKVALGNDVGGFNIKFMDNGKGINDKDVPCIFERFYKADPSRTGHNGLGIGLTLVRSILQKHGGSIEYDETAKPGTHFTLVIPQKKQR